MLILIYALSNFVSRPLSKFRGVDSYLYGRWTHTEHTRRQGLHGVQNAERTQRDKADDSRVCRRGKKRFISTVKDKHSKKLNSGVFSVQASSVFQWKSFLSNKFSEKSPISYLESSFLTAQARWNKRLSKVLLQDWFYVIAFKNNTNGRK